MGCSRSSFGCRQRTGWDMAFIMIETPTHRRPLLELRPHITLDYHPVEPAITFDDSTARAVARQEQTEMPVEPDDAPDRGIIVAEPPVAAMKQLPPPPPPPPPSVGWLTDDSGGMPMRPMQTLLRFRVPPPFAFDDFVGFGPAIPIFLPQENQINKEILKSSGML